MTAILTVTGLTVSFGGVRALQGVNLRVASRSIHGLIGPNGAGKTTLLNCIGRVIRPCEGIVRFEQQDLLACPLHQLMSLGIARTFQNLALMDDATVLENVQVGTRYASPGLRLGDFLPTRTRAGLEQQSRASAIAVLDLLGLAEYAGAVVGKLPYGIRKSVEIARALCAQPKLLMLDEPTAGLNASEMEQLAAAVKRIRTELALTVLLITHHIEFLLEVADEVTVLDLGQVIAHGAPRLVHTDERVRAAYLGADA